MIMWAGSEEITLQSLSPKKGFTRFLCTRSSGSVLGWSDRSENKGCNCGSNFTEADVWRRDV